MNPATSPVLINEKILSPKIYEGNVCVKSAMNTHKTQSLLQYLKDKIDCIILFITNKINQSYDFVQKLSTIQKMEHIWNYKEEKFFNHNAKWIIIQPESLYRLSRFDKNFDLVVLDEVVSIFQQFISPTQKDNAVCNFFHFCSTTKQAKQIIAMDADIEEFHVNMLQQVSSKIFKYIINEFKHSQKKHYVTQDKEAFFQVMREQAGIGHTFVFCSASKQKVNFVREMLLGIGVKQDKILVYHSDEDDKSHHFKEGVDNVWVNYDYVLYTNTIPNGISFNISDHFAYVFSYLNNNTFSTRVLTQCEDRVRNPYTNEIYTLIKKKKNSFIYPEHEDDVEKLYKLKYKQIVLHLEEKMKLVGADLRQLDKIVGRNIFGDFDQECKWLRQIFYYYKAEDYRTYNNPVNEYIQKKWSQGREVISLIIEDENDEKYGSIVNGNYVNRKEGIKIEAMVNYQVREKRVLEYDDTEDINTTEIDSKINALLEQQKIKKLTRDELYNLDMLRKEKKKPIEEIVEKIKKNKASKEDKIKLNKEKAKKIGIVPEGENMVVFENHKSILFNRFYFEHPTELDIERDLKMLEQNEFNYKCFDLKKKTIQSIIDLVRNVKTEEDMASIEFDFNNAYSVFDLPPKQRTQKEKKDSVYKCNMFNILLYNFCFEIEKKRKSGRNGSTYEYRLANIGMYDNIYYTG